MQFLGTGKNKRKCVLNAVPNPEVSGSGAEFAEKDFGVSGAKALAARAKVARRFRFSAKPLISTHLTRERCKSFISNTYVTWGGGGVRAFFGNGEILGKAMEMRDICGSRAAGLGCGLVRGWGETSRLYPCLSDASFRSRTCLRVGRPPASQ